MTGPRGHPDAVVVGSGPNGLAAAVVLARAGLGVHVYEAAAEPGGGCRTAELTLPGFRHDVCAAAHPLAAASPFFRALDLEGLGVRLLSPPVPFAHPLDGGRAAAVQGSVEETAAALGTDERPYRRLFGPLVEANDAVVTGALSTLRRRPPPALGALALFAVGGALPAAALAACFHTDAARALLSGLAAHAMRPIDRPLTGAVALLLGSIAHRHGWPVVEGGSGALTGALLRVLRAEGATIETGSQIRSLAELPPARVVLLDVGPHQLAALAGASLDARHRRRLQRFRYGAGTCKVDWALSGPVPWTAAVCRQAGTLHLGGTFEEVAAAAAAVRSGRHPHRPFVLAVQAGVVDPTRAPPGAHTLWTYCAVPWGSDRDMRPAIAAQVERFAPGFSDLVLAASVRRAVDGEAGNANLVGGAIDGGEQDVRQTIARPFLRWNPYRTPLPGVYLCSASTPPGPGVHGRCGELAARAALRDEFGIEPPNDAMPNDGAPDGT